MTVKILFVNTCSNHRQRKIINMPVSFPHNQFSVVQPMLPELLLHIKMLLLHTTTEQLPLIVTIMFRVLLTEIIFITCETHGWVQQANAHGGWSLQTDSISAWSPLMDCGIECLCTRLKSLVWNLDGIQVCQNRIVIPEWEWCPLIEIHKWGEPWMWSMVARPVLDWTPELLNECFSSQSSCPGLEWLVQQAVHRAWVKRTITISNANACLFKSPSMGGFNLSLFLDKEDSVLCFTWCCRKGFLSPLSFYKMPEHTVQLWRNIAKQRFQQLHCVCVFFVAVNF